MTTPKAGVRAQPLIAVRDVEASTSWYARHLVNADAVPVGHGVLLWFEVDDFDAAVNRARSLEATVLAEPHVNPAPQHREMWLRDPDGYVVVIASADGEAAKSALSTT